MQPPVRKRKSSCFGWIKLFLILMSVRFLTVPRTELQNYRSVIVLEQHAQEKKRDLEGNLITLVTGLWALANNEITHPHRAEVEASLIANLDNQHIHQVLVVLDSVSEDTQDCSHLANRLTRLGWQSRHPSHLTCIERAEGQPTYYEMFQFTLHPNVEGSIAVLSNADQVFDDTLEIAKRIPSNVFWTLSTHGYFSSWVPPRLSEIYDRIVGEFKDEEDVALNRCEWKETLAGQIQYQDSWDTYIFRPETIAGSLDATRFMRRDFYRRPVPFYMNEYAAEYAALHAVSMGLKDVSFWNACRMISSWHFHLRPKMHGAKGVTAKWPGGVPLSRVITFKGIVHFDDGTDSPKHKPGDIVPYPWAWNPTCAGEEECFSSNKTLGVLHIYRR